MPVGMAFAFLVYKSELSGFIWVARLRSTTSGCPLFLETCPQHEIPYTERSLADAFFTVVAYLNQVSVKHRDPYVCPLV